MARKKGMVGAGALAAGGPGAKPAHPPTPMAGRPPPARPPGASPGMPGASGIAGPPGAIPGGSPMGGGGPPKQGGGIGGAAGFKKGGEIEHESKAERVKEGEKFNRGGSVSEVKGRVGRDTTRASKSC